MLFTIKRTISYKDEKVVCLLYKALVRPILEYAQEVWQPHLKQDIVRLEKVQQRLTKSIPTLKHLSYEERLRKLDLPTLVYRRMRGDMISLYKITHGLMNCNIPLARNTNNTRGHNYKLYIHGARTNIRKRFFSNRVAIPWNSLSTEVVNAPTVNSFKTRLDRAWANNPYKFQFDYE